MIQAGITLILVILALIGFSLTAFGTPVGIVLLILFFAKKKHKSSEKLLKWALFLLSGIPLLVLVFAAYAIFQFIFTLFGINALSVPDGGLKTLQ